MPTTTAPATLTGEAQFIARGLRAADGTADLALLCARFVDTLHDRPGLEGARLEPAKSGKDWVLRHAGDPRANIVYVIPQITLRRLAVSLYGRPEDHRAWHGDSCLLTWEFDYSYAGTHVSTPDELADLASHIDRSWALKQLRYPA